MEDAATVMMMTDAAAWDPTHAERENMHRTVETADHISVMTATTLNAKHTLHHGHGECKHEDTTRNGGWGMHQALC